MTQKNYAMVNSNAPGTGLTPLLGGSKGEKAKMAYCLYGYTGEVLSYKDNSLAAAKSLGEKQHWDCDGAILALGILCFSVH